MITPPVTCPAIYPPDTCCLLDAGHKPPHRAADGLQWVTPTYYLDEPPTPDTPLTGAS